jgi:hypothetical protein
VAEVASAILNFVLAQFTNSFAPATGQGEVFDRLKFLMFQAKHLFHDGLIRASFVLFIDCLGQDDSEARKGALLGELVGGLGIDEHSVHVKDNRGRIHGLRDPVRL